MLSKLKNKILLNVTKLVKNPLLINILIVGSLTILVKLVGFYKEATIASYFGLSELLDTFFIALLIPAFLQNVFINGLNKIFIPNYINNLKEKKNQGEFQSIVFILTFSISLLFFILTWIFINIFLEKVYPGHTSEYYTLIKKQLFYLLPCLFFWGASSIIGGLLEVSNKFFLTTISPIFSAIIILICLNFFSEKLGETVLAIGTLIGAIFTFLYKLLIVLYYKELFISKPRLNNNSIIMLKQLPSKISAGLLSGMNNYIDQFFAAQLVIGSITALNYGIKIPFFIISILTVAFGNVLLPHFSRLISVDLEQAYQQLFKILKIIFVSSLIIVIIAAFYSDLIISILFERNAFDANSTILVSKIQKISFVYVPFYLCVAILVRFLTSINKNKFMAWISFFSLILNVILNTVLIKHFEIYGLVVSTALIYILICFFYLQFTLKQYKLLRAI